MPQLTELYRYMFPFLTGDEGRPDVLGTGFIVAVDRYRFIITAAHVVEAEDSSTLRFGRNIISNSGSVAVVTTKMPSSRRREDDRLDLAIWRADEQLAASLLAQGIQPIGIELAGVEDVAESGNRYVFSGYPSSRTRTNRTTREIDPGPISACCEAVIDDRLLDLELQSSTHIIGSFERRRMANIDGEQITAPEPWGMSGGPVWKIQGDSCRLAGVGIEYRERKNALVATRLGAVVALLRANYPETRPFLAEPRYFTVR